MVYLALLLGLGSRSARRGLIGASSGGWSFC